MRTAAKILLLFSYFANAQEGIYLKNFIEFKSSIESSLKISLDDEFAQYEGSFPIDGTGDDISKNYLLSILSMANLACEKALNRDIRKFKYNFYVFVKSSSHFFPMVNIKTRINFWNDNLFHHLNRSLAVNLWGRDFTQDELKEKLIESKELLETIKESSKENKDFFSFKKYLENYKLNFVNHYMLLRQLNIKIDVDNKTTKEVVNNNYLKDTFMITNCASFIASPKFFTK